MASNQVSLFGSIKVNGLYIVGGKFFTDCAPDSIVSVQPCRIFDAQGVRVNAFKIDYEDSRSLTLQTFYMITHTGMTTLDNFRDGLTAYAAKNKFTIYYNLRKSSDVAASMIALGTNLLLNDAKYTRTYALSLNQTVVNLNVSNSLVKKQFYFAGDQTIAGYYYYFYSWGY